MSICSPGREWAIRIIAPLPGIDLDASFVIPLAPSGTPAVVPDPVQFQTPAPLPRPEAVVTGGTMTCPKCGSVQPVAVECSVCRLIIAKYQPRPALASPRKSLVFPILIVALMFFGLVTLVAGGGIAIWKSFFDGRSEEFVASSGVYSNPHYGLTLTLPNEWKRYSVEEAITCSTLRDDYADHYLLLASPTTPAETLLVVNLSGLSLDYFRSTGWNGIVDDYRSRNPVRFTEVVPVGGFQLQRMGYTVAGFYREDAMFEAGGKLLEIYFYLPDGPDAAARAGQIRNFINDSLVKL